MAEKSSYPTLQPPQVDEYPPDGRYPASAPPGDSWEASEQQAKSRVNRPEYPPRTDSSKSGFPASQPPADDQHGSHSQQPLPLQAALSPFKLAHGIFGVVCKTFLAPLRAAIGQQIPFSHRRHLVLLPERLESFMGDLTFLKVQSLRVLRVTLLSQALLHCVHVRLA
jgi:hypothetical protein